MSHSIRIDSKSALIGIAAALGCVVAMGQVSVSRATTPTAAIAPGYGIGNPHPRDMVHFSSTTGSAFNVQIPPGGEHVVFLVPVDRWLVLLSSLGDGSLTGGCPFDDSGGQATLRLYEDLNGSYTLKAIEGSNVAGVANLGPAGGSVGWAFKPGSRVILKNESSSDPASTRFNFFGYLTGL